MLKASARIFPIGFIIPVDAPNFNPHDFYIDGVWEQIKGRVIVGVDENQTEFNETGKTGGSKTHTLTVNEMPQHNHSQARAYNTNGFEALYKEPFTGWGLPDTNETGASILNGNYTGGDQAHNNLQPYQTAYMWKLISYSN